MENKCSLLKLYQIQYSDETSPKLSLLEAFDVRNNPEYLKRETAHFIDFYDKKIKTGTANCYYGLFSPKFLEKTHIRDSQWLTKQCTMHPNADVIIINPHIVDVYKFLNVWEQAEYWHHGIIDLAQLLFDHSGLNYNIRNDLHRHSIKNTVYCNYWIAKKPFWDVYIAFIKHMNHTIDNLPQEKRDRFFSKTYHGIEACFYPFIFERLITTLLEINTDITVANIDLSEKFIESKKFTSRELYFLEHIKPIIDQWEKQSERDIGKLRYINKSVRSYLGFGIPVRPPLKFLKRLYNSIKKQISTILSSYTINVIKKCCNSKMVSVI